jgi:membrane protein implicated in regulation of membrane protease activity
MMNRLHWILFWFAEIVIAAAASLGLIPFLYIAFYIRTGRLIPVEFAEICFLAMWLQFVLFASRGLVLKLQIWRRLRSLPREERTLEEAKSMLLACAGRGLWRLPKSSLSESNDKTI